MSLAVVAPGKTQPLDEKHPALRLVSLPRFLYLANYYLDSGQNTEQTAQLMQALFHDTFQKNFRRGVTPNDILLAREVLHHRVPSAALRFEMARWALTLSKEFRRMAGFVTKNAPQFDDNEARLMTENFSGYLSKRTFNSGYVFKGNIQPCDIRSSFVLYPEDAKIEVPKDFATAEAAIFEWCRIVPFQHRDRSLVAYAKYFGDEELVNGLYSRCRDACAAPLPGFMTEEQKQHHEQLGVECFWTMVEYINWLTNHNPMDLK